MTTAWVDAVADVTALLHSTRDGVLFTNTHTHALLHTHSTAHLQEIAVSCVTKRAVGSSTEHAQSSRSHALLRMDVTTSSVLEAQARVEAAKARSGPLRNGLENALAEGLADLFDGVTGPETCKLVLRVLDETGTPGEPAYTTLSPFDGSEVHWYAHHEGVDLEVDVGVAGKTGAGRKAPSGPLSFSFGEGDE